MHHRLANQNPPPHPARKAARRPVRQGAQMHGRENFVCAPLRGRYAVQAGLKFQQFARREEGVDIDFLRHYANGTARLATVTVNIEIPNSHLAPALYHQSGQNIDKGGLARTIRTQQADNRAPGNVQVNAAQGLDHLATAIGLSQTAGFDGQIGQWLRRGSSKGGCLGHGAPVDCRAAMGIIRMEHFQCRRDHPGHTRSP